MRYCCRLCRLLLGVWYKRVDNTSVLHSRQGGKRRPALLQASVVQIDLLIRVRVTTNAEPCIGGMVGLVCIKTLHQLGCPLPCLSIFNTTSASLADTMTANAAGIPWNGRRSFLAETEELEKGLVAAWIEESEAMYGLRGEFDENERSWDERYQRVATAMLDADGVPPLRASDLTYGISEMDLYLPVSKVRLSNPIGRFRFAIRRASSAVVRAGIEHPRPTDVCPSDLRRTR